MASLQRCVHDVDAFAVAWGVHPLVVRRTESPAPGMDTDGTAGFGDLLSIADVDRIVSTSARRPTVRMIAAGDPVDPASYCTPVRLGGRHVDDVVDPRKVADQLMRGSTLVLQSLHRTWPAIIDVVADLQEELGHPVQANAYLTPAGASGLAPHSDAHDVIVLQLHGSKHWHVGELGDIELSSGDMMYLPAGTSHSATAADRPSLHLTLGVIRVTYRAVLERILRDGPDLLDSPLPIGYRNQHDDGLRHRLITMLEDVREHLVELDIDERIEVERRRRLAPPVRLGRVSSMLSIDDLTSDHSIRWIGQPPMVRRVDDTDAQGWVPPGCLVPGDGRVDIHLGERRLTVPASVLDAIVALGRDGPVRVGNLPDLDNAGQLVLARRLVQEGACVIDQPTAPPRFRRPSD